MRKLVALIFLSGSLVADAGDPYPVNDAIDILHYRFQLALNDSTDVISGQATITLKFRKSVPAFELDLANKNSQGSGMQVNQIIYHGSPLRFVHQNDRLKIDLPAAPTGGDEIQITVFYGGVPQDGLIISKNRYGDRTFFGDNWPDRAHHWLPSIDHPSDKATCEFLVIAPDHYQVIANGKRTEQCRWLKNQTLTHWEETAPIPMKVMAIGAARFAIQEPGRVENIPVESWVYPQDREAGFSDFAVAVKILNFLQDELGPYSYEKLANVQSTTRYGGMENASNIFYAENFIDKKNNDDVIAHEIAHQWFGNSATEKNWHHVWLSESFATYFSRRYLAWAYGNEYLVSRLQEDRKRTIEYFKTHPAPVIDTTVVDLMKLLNPNSYEKGGWVLHMLRHEIGDVLFRRGIQTYYRTYRNGNALTGDFQRIIEEVSGRDLQVFFNQWLWNSGHPKIAAHWKYNAGNKTIRIKVDQVQPGIIFQTPLDIGIRSAGGTEIQTLKLDRKRQEFSIPSQNRPLEVTLDPMTWLLLEGEIEADR